MTSLLAVRDLKKSIRSHWTFRGKTILQSVTFEINSGDIFGFLGRNGAGKTTTIKTILGLIHKDSGEILFEGALLNSVATRATFGYLPELPYFYDHLTVEETLRYFGSLALSGATLSRASNAEVERQIDRVLQRVGLNDRRKSKVKSLSKGMQQRLGLAQAIINSPKMLFLDEPFSGLDPIGRAEFREILLELNRSGTTILISSHILADVEALCNRVSILANGAIKKSFALTERAQLFGEKMELTVEQTGTSGLLEELKQLAESFTERSVPAGNETKLAFSDHKAAERGLELALGLQKKGGLLIRDFRSRPRPLEDIFIDLTAKEKTKEKIGAV